jgi:RNA polymerase sigma-70 factor (ECF subfamily)
MDRRVDQIFDEMLVLLAQDGDVQALERLAARWRPRHYAHARRLLGSTDGAADAVQDAWMGILRGLRRLRDPARFRAWSYAIVTRRCQDALRRRQHEPVGDPNAQADDSQVLHTSQVDDLKRAIATLPAPQRAAVALYYGDELSVTEIAEALQVPVGTVKSRLYHARRTLRRHLSGDDP